MAVQPKGKTPLPLEQRFTHGTLGQDETPAVRVTELSPHDVMRIRMAMEREALVAPVAIPVPELDTASIRRVEMIRLGSDLGLNVTGWDKRPPEELRKTIVTAYRAGGRKR
jgi:hypothetical protein